MPCSIAFHHFFEHFVKLLFMLKVCHVNKINDNDSAHITQAQLTCNLTCCHAVGFKCIVFLTVAVTTVSSTTIHINHMHSFSMLYHKICTVLHGHCFA